MNLILILAAFLFSSCTTTIKPVTVEDFYKTSVMIVNENGSSGGTGVIYKSSPTGSVVLTNRHVCQLLESGGYVLNQEQYSVVAYKTSKVHDVCMVWVKENLKINTSLATNPPEMFEEVVISGHPDLYPHIVSRGTVSESFKIEIVISSRECTQEEFKKDPFTCVFYGYPITEELEAQLVSALIAPGSSGSAVFNSQGEIVGLAFASNSRELSYALVVPWDYVSSFVKHEKATLKWQFPKKVTRTKEDSKKANNKAYIAPFSEIDVEVLNNKNKWKLFLDCVTKNLCKTK